MPTTGITNGTDFLLYISTDNGSTYSKIYHSTSASLSVSMETRDASSKDSNGWKDVLEGQRSWTMEAEGLAALDATWGYQEVFTAMEGRTKIKLKFSTEVTSDEYFFGDGYITSLSLDAPNEDSSTFSVSIEGTGALDTGTVPA